jgi:hypothetical protein
MIPYKLPLYLYGSFEKKMHIILAILINSVVSRINVAVRVIKRNLIFNLNTFFLIK